MKSQKGQSLVETALILPVLLLLIFGITDFGRIFHAYLTIDHASREAARVAVVGSDDATIDSTIQNATSSINKDLLTVEYTPNSERVSGKDVTITLTYNIDFLTPMIDQIINTVKKDTDGIEGFELKEKTVMRVE